MNTGHSHWAQHEQEAKVRGNAETGTEEQKKDKEQPGRALDLSVSSLPNLIPSLFPSPSLFFSLFFLFFSLPLCFPLFPPPTFSCPSLSLSHSFLDAHYLSLKSQNLDRQGQCLTGGAMAQPWGPISLSI